jgi:GTPase involved in cell partitioning and DNA repair
VTSEPGKSSLLRVLSEAAPEIPSKLSTTTVLPAIINIFAMYFIP